MGDVPILEAGAADASVAGTGIRRVALPDGRTLMIRPVGLDDVEALGALYDGLTVEDLHNRFFSVFHPDQEFLERLATVAERGGCGLVAVVSATDDEDGRLVAESSYQLLANGDGELAITVARDWRGWLGTFLLDALIETASARDVPNLEADILVTNTPMVRLARARGVATMPSDDWVSERLLMGTAGRVPVWPVGDERPRVIVEVPGGRWHAAVAARSAGLQVLSCSGPRGRRARCPVLDGESCPLAVGADAIVVSHAPDDDEWKAVSDAHPRLHPGVPVCVETGPVRDVEAVVAQVERLAKQRCGSR